MSINLTPSIAGRAVSLGAALRPGAGARSAEDQPKQEAPAQKRTLDNTRVGIVVPMSWPLHWQLWGCAMQDLEKGPNPLKYEVRDATIASMRNTGIRQALAGGAEVVLLCDADMTYHPSALRRLVDHDVPAVGGLCRGRIEPFDAMLWTRDGRGLMRHQPEGSGLRPYTATGGAFLVVQAHVFHALDKTFGCDGRYFVDQRDRQDLPPEERVSEDIYFCTLLEKASIPLYVDMDVKIGHITTGIVIDGDDHTPQLMLQRGL